MAPKNTTEEFISKSIKVHGDFWHGNPKKYSSDIIQYLNETKRKCEECGSFYMYPFVYKEHNICEDCNHLHIEKHTHLWKQIMEYCTCKGMV